MRASGHCWSIRVGYSVCVVALGFLLGCGGGTATPGGDGTGTVQGTVTDAATSDPIAGAMVAVQGTALQATTNAQGQYTIQNVPQGAQTAVASASGYASQNQSVTVTAGAISTVDFSLAALPVAENAYYVAPTGSDTNPGTSESPWRTIQHAADTLVAGETVYIRGGTYNEAVRPMNSGSAAGAITFSAYPGETPIIDGTGVTDTVNGIIVDQSYIRLVGLEVQNWNGNAIWIENAAYLEISDCVVHDVAFGIGVSYGTHDFQFNRVVAHHFDLYGFDVSPGGGADCYNGVFNDCVAHTGRDPQQNVDGFALGHGTQHDFALNRCVTYNVFDGFDISSRDSTLNRCAAYDCWNGGYKIWQDAVTLLNCLSYHNAASNVELDWDEEPGTVTLWNCTLMDAGSFNVWVENAGDSLHMYNCIVAGSDNIGLAFEQMGVGNYQGDYNLFHNDNPARAVVVGYTDEFSLDQLAAGAWTTYAGGQDAHSLTASSVGELFVNPTTFDLHLLATSPAVDHGTSSGAPSEDYEGTARPQGGGHDIGAYEG